MGWDRNDPREWAKPGRHPEGPPMEPDTNPVTPKVFLIWLWLHVPLFLGPNGPEKAATSLFLGAMFFWGMDAYLKKGG